MGVTVKALDHLIVGARLFAISNHSHFDTLFGMSTNGLINHPSSGHYSTDYSLILTTDSARLQLGNQIRVGSEIFGYYHQAGGVFVEAMDDSSTGHCL